jgi:hypothetical protein
MINRKLVLSVFIVFLAIGGAWAQEQTLPSKPQPTVPEIFTIEGQFVRVAYNQEGFATLGYRTSQYSIGSDWILLNVGITLREGAKDQELKRESISLKIPDGTVIPLATRAEFNKAGGCRNLVLRDNKINDSIDYFPNTVNHACAMRFFGPPGQISFNQVELDSDRACLGRLFFNIPGGIVTGQYWLLIKFANSELQVPFRILTKEEEEIFKKKWQEMKKEHEEALKGE